MTDALKTLSSFLVKDWDVDGLHLEFSDILTPEQRELMEFYDLSLHQAEILSYLTYYHGKRISERKLKELGYQDTFEMDIPKDLSDLVERKFIRREPMRDDCSLYDPSFCYILTEKAYEAFLGDEGFGERYFEDCLTEVLSVDFKHMFSMNWRNAMERSLYTPSNSRLFEKLWGLGFDKLEKSERLAFWVMVRQFFFYFTAPLAFRNSEDILNGTGYSQEVLKSDLGHLVEKGLVQTLPIEPLEDTKDTDRFVLAPKAAGALFHGDKEVIRYEEMAKYADVIKAGDIVPKPPFFSRESEEEIDHLRRTRAAVSLDDEEGEGAAVAESVADAGPCPAEAFESQATAEDVFRAVKTLPEGPRQVLLMRVEGGLSFREIADELSVPLGTALTWMRSATTKIRRMLEGEK